MKHLPTFEEFVKSLNETANQSDNSATKKRMQKLAGIEIDNSDDQYCILITVGESDGRSLITEHEKYQSFKKTTNRYLYHPENPDIPVKAHYHIYPNNGKQEIYSVNMDGTAHHKKNRGYQVPSKEAKELRALGVTIPDDRIIENIQVDFDYSNSDSVIILFD